MQILKNAKLITSLFTITLNTYEISFYLWLKYFCCLKCRVKNISQIFKLKDEHFFKIINFKNFLYITYTIAFGLRLF